MTPQEIRDALDEIRAKLNSMIASGLRQTQHREAVACRDRIDAMKASLAVVGMERDPRLLTEMVARSFCRAMAVEVGPQYLMQIVTKNRIADDGLCHSHDYCDANLVMDFALRENGICVDWNLPMPDKVQGIYNAAWDAAKAAEFDERKVKVST